MCICYGWNQNEYLGYFHDENDRAIVFRISSKFCILWKKITREVVVSNGYFQVVPNEQAHHFVFNKKVRSTEKSIWRRVQCTTQSESNNLRCWRKVVVGFNFTHRSYSIFHSINFFSQMKCLVFTDHDHHHLCIMKLDYGIMVLSNAVVPWLYP